MTAEILRARVRATDELSVFDIHYEGDLVLSATEIRFDGEAAIGRLGARMMQVERWSFSLPLARVVAESIRLRGTTGRKVLEIRCSEAAEDAVHARIAFGSAYVLAAGAALGGALFERVGEFAGEKLGERLASAGDAVDAWCDAIHRVAGAPR